MIKKIIYTGLCAVIICFMSVGYTYSISKDLHDNIVRLHVIANSNSETDQNIKYMVRDELIKKSTELKDSKFSVESIDEIARKVLLENNASYDAVCETGDFYFPKKHYENIVMPEGMYRGVRVILGDGRGENWWCVISPPMCFTKNCIGEANTSELKKTLNPDTIEVISDKGGINYKFKLIEVLKNILE